MFGLKVMAQENTQCLRGKCVDALSLKPVSGALVSISGPEKYQVSTDSMGIYTMAVIPGKYSLLVEQNNYKNNVRENVIVNKGKQSVQDFELDEFRVELNTVTVKPTNSEGIELNNWNMQQFAAVFYDPARVINSHAGVVNSDDQANHLTVRGTSPNFVQWKLEGVEIVNPNHLENAGTFNDRPASNGGGVSMVSAQLLNNSEFHFAPFDPSLGNSLSGVFDMKFRKGNDQKAERIISASLLGTDISLEGPFSKNKSASYLFNFRYSTVGLLSLMGLNFGDEKINYTDFSFMLSFPYKRSTTKLFGVTGTSQSLFKGKRDTSLVEIEKDLQDIDYRSFTSINGASFITSLSNSLLLKTVVAYSEKKVIRKSGPATEYWAMPSEDELYRQQKISSVVYLSKRISNSITIKGGSYVNYFMYNIKQSFNQESFINGRIDEPLIQPFVSAEGTLFEKLDYRVGVHSVYQARINDFRVQPRGMLRYNITETRDLTLNYGETSQLQPFYIYLSNEQNNKLKPVDCQALSLQYKIRFKTNTIKLQGYYQDYRNLPVNTTYSFSVFNYFNEQFNFPLHQNGKGKVIGTDITYEKHMNGFYLIASASVYNSLYSLDKNVFYNCRYNTGYNAVATTGKEHKLKSGRKFISGDIRVISRNGYKESYMAASPYLYDKQLPSYLRLDVRLSYKKNKESSTVIWAIDLQNASNSKNVAYHYYDIYTKQTETRYQLGLIPVLSYKVLF
jgi:hypothetical protein